MNSFVMGDANKCIGCQACMIACARAHEKLPVKELAELSVPFLSRVKVFNTPELTGPVQCRQCEEAPCAQACKMNAIIKKDSHIEILRDRCIGCKRCVRACPFGAISVALNRPTREEMFSANTEDRPKKVKKTRFIIDKCDLCTDAGGPSCIDICPAQALHLVDADDVQNNVSLQRYHAASQLEDPQTSPTVL